MRILRRFGRMPSALRGGAFAIGNFDGVHRGHREVIAAAQGSGVSPLGVLLFAPHPRRYFRPRQPFACLTSLRAKLCLLEGLGVEVAVVAPFDARMAGRSAAAFVREVLAEQLAARHAAVGWDFAFGRGREGDAAALRRLGAEAGISVSVAAEVSWDGAACSSTRARAALSAGDLAAAADLLGHVWGVEGIVARGDGRGRELGYATANLPLADMDTGELFPLPFGIYAAWVEIEGDGAGYRPAAVSVGRRPTFPGAAPVLEAHLLDFDRDIYGRRLWVFPAALLRGEKKFARVADLQAQMAADCREARERLGADGVLAPDFS